MHAAAHGTAQAPELASQTNADGGQTPFARAGLAAAADIFYLGVQSRIFFGEQIAGLSRLRCRRRGCGDGLDPTGRRRGFIVTS
ncbi:MAG: hypothetical protein ACXU9D_27605, partial [Xanthobacteraceae bacterium]